MTDLRGHVSARVDGIGFSFYTKEQILGVSVKRVTQTPAFDLQGIPVCDSLYDPAMGPLGAMGVCITCGLSSRFCPGHCGHIELPVPIINPLLFSPCFKILQTTCHNCYNFRVRGGQPELDFVKARLRLLDEGRIIEAANLARRADGEYPEVDVLDRDPCNVSLLGNTKRAEILSELNHKLSNSGKCPFCGAHSPKLRSHQKSKVLVEKLSLRMVAHNKALGIDMHPNVFHRREIQDDEAIEIVGRLDQEYKPGDVLDVESEEANDGEEEEIKDEEAAAQRHWMTPLEVEEHLRRVWSRSPRLCSLMFNHLITSEDGRFERIATSHEVFLMRYLLVPPSRFRPPQVTASTGRPAEHAHNSHLNKVLMCINAFAQDSRIENPKEAAAAKARLWHQMQVHVATYFDASRGKGKDVHPGIKQVLDKKEGLFRRNMMGKRVNYAARTVISPDPYIETDEIGIPMVFAKKLTFPTPVTWHNYKQLAQAVINGPNVHPGASQVEKDGFVKKLEHMSKDARIALSKTLMDHAPLEPASTAVVHAHVRSGDYVLLNRQPSLHKPSMMGQRVRVLGQERTMRMHYANCSSFNADFDGDEMNIHLPQSLNAKADIRFAAMSRDQYLSAKDGGPLRGLIQDHVLSGVLLTMKDTFFSRTDYQLLVYSSIYAVRPGGDIETEPPAFLKPVRMWTGKQVISTIVKHVLSGKPMFNFVGSARIKGSMWGTAGEEEGSVQFCGGDLVTGVIDKNQSGASANGFVHACYTLYGGDVAERLLSCLGRVFTKFLQMYGFTCGLEDFLLNPKVEAERRRILDLATERSAAAAKSFVEEFGNTGNESLEQALQDRLVKVPTDESRLDNAMKKVSHTLTSSVVDSAIPTGMMKPFPHNNFFLMVMSGAKGSTVNFSMITCCLGQMELEGRRVARTPSGRTLPGFAPYQMDVVAGGFISQRFLTGIRPCEFYFHCMAGREGLIDTAVKTSRSGYLQRCIIKHLESLTVAYDGTVRDSDGSIVQFAYGEDGLDPVHHGSVHNLKLWSDNSSVAAMRLPRMPEKELDPIVENYHKRFFSKTLALPNFGGHRMLPRSSEISAGSLIESRSPFELGVVSDKFLEKIRDAKISDPALIKRMLLNYLRLLAPPGESVGVLAGQSIGEPSTQMTLNTFHLAGHGDVNVTLGIPRLRELLMGATTPKIPSMTVPVRADVNPEALAKFRRGWKNGVASALVTQVVCSRVLPVDESNVTLHTIFVKFDKDSCEEFGVSWREVVQLMSRVVEKLRLDIVKDVRQKTRRLLIASAKTIHVNENDDGEPVAEKKSGRKKKSKTVDDEEEEQPDEDEERDEERDVEEEEDDEGNDDDIADEDEEDEEEVDEDEDVEEMIDDDEVDDSESPSRKNLAGIVDLVDEDDEVVAEKQSEVERMNYEDSFEEPDGEVIDAADLHTGVEVEGSIDKNGFLSAKLGKHASGSDIVRVIGLASHQKDGVVRFRLVTNLSGPQVLVSSLVELAIQSTPIRIMPLIKRTVFNEAAGDKPAHVITEGSNIEWLCTKFAHILNLNELKCNDIGHILRTYGVEAARTALVEEIGAVFKAYGINVGYRHLSLIADYQTFHGRYRGFNRHSMSEHKNSPLLNMSFETTLGFATSAALAGKYDDCKTASARIVLGMVPNIGSGCMDLFVPLDTSNESLF